MYLCLCVPTNLMILTEFSTFHFIFAHHFPTHSKTCSYLKTHICHSLLSTQLTIPNNWKINSFWLNTRHTNAIYIQLKTRVWTPYERVVRLFQALTHTSTHAEYSLVAYIISRTQRHLSIEQSNSMGATIINQCSHSRLVTDDCNDTNDSTSWCI